MFILIDVGFLALVGQRLLANLPAQTSVEATSIAANTTTVGRAGLGSSEARPDGTLGPRDWAEAGLGNQSSYGILRGFVVALTADVFALRGFAPISAG